jgi:hypothetical protein
MGGFFTERPSDRKAMPTGHGAGGTCGRLRENMRKFNDFAGTWAKKTIFLPFRHLINQNHQP